MSAAGSIGIPRWPRVGSWMAIAALTAIMVVATITSSLDRYEQFRSGFSWDLAYYNQWLWAVTRGDGQLTVRPAADYGFEGPSVWQMNYLSPVRLAVVPVYMAFADPRTLLVIQSVVFWLIIPAAYTLIRSESKSERLALAVAALVPLTPIAWPLAVNDFRELQLAGPAVLWAIQGWRERRRGLATAGIAGLLACRQEFSLIVASLALLPPQQPDVVEVGRTWARTAIIVGCVWFIVFLVYLTWRADLHTAADYLIQFATPTASFADTAGHAFRFLLVGLASWSILAFFAPRVALLAVPWVWVLSGRWDVQLVSTSYWHHVRYTAPLTFLMLAAGLIGFAHAGRFFAAHQRVKGLAAIWLVAAGGLVAQTVVVQREFAKVPSRISSSEAAQLWSYIRQVDGADGVLTAFDVAAPLSSRRWLFGYEIEEIRPSGYPRLHTGIRWAFVRSDQLPARMFVSQGFAPLPSGPFIQVFRRTAEIDSGERQK